MSHETALKLIADELAKARAKHPVWPNNAYHAAAIITEEIGELCQALLQNRAKDSIAEAVQIAATAIRYITGE